MKKNNLLQKLQNVFQDSEDKNLEGFKAFDEGVAKLKAELRQKITVNTLDDVNSELDKFKKRIDLQPLIESVDSLREDFSNEIDNLVEQLEGKLGELSNLNTQTVSRTNTRSELLNEEISKVRGQIKDLIVEKNENLSSLNQEFSARVSSLKKEIYSDTESKMKLVGTKIESLSDDYFANKKSTSKEIEDLKEKIPKLRTDLMNRFADRGAGNMNRQIVVGGNPSTLGKYTDINIKAGNNMTISYQNNETTKQTDITFTSSGGGSSTVGIIRSINTINTSQTAGDTAGTDYVYICTAGIRLELPTPLGNSNLYTVKNYSASSVLVAGTIDSDASGIIMPIQYTSVDLVSNEVDNFNLT